MKTLEKFKLLFKDAEYDPDTDCINVYCENGNVKVSLFYAKELIEECFIGQAIETNEFNPEHRTWIDAGTEAYIISEYGDYQSAYKAI